MPIYEYKPDFLSILKRRKRNVQDFFRINIGSNTSNENVDIIIENLKKEYSLNKNFWGELAKYKKNKEKEIESARKEEEAREKSRLKAKHLEQERVNALRERRKQALEEQRKAEEETKEEEENPADPKPSKEKSASISTATRQKRRVGRTAKAKK